MNEKFFIYKKSYLKDEKIDLSFIPMMARRKLSPLAKIAFSTIFNCYEKDNINLVFSSQYGEVDKLLLLIDQYKNDNEVSPIAFSSSVHNSTIGTFSILNSIKKKYNSISAGKNTLSNGLLEAVMGEENVIFCYADTLPQPQSVSCLIGPEKRENSDEIEVILTSNQVTNDEYKRFTEFLDKKTEEFITPFYTLRRKYD